MQNTGCTQKTNPQLFVDVQMLKILLIKLPTQEENIMGVGLKCGAAGWL